MKSIAGLLLVLVLGSQTPADDPLPSWKDTAPKKAIAALKQQIAAGRLWI